MNIPDDFDIAAAKVAGQTANADPIDQAAARVVQGQRTALRSSLYGALLENPDVAARAQKLGRKTGLPADVVGRNLPEVERNAKLNEFDQLLQNSPVVAQWLADQNNAKVAHDDVGNMSEHERLFREALAAGRVAQGRIGETYVRPTDNMWELDRSIVQAFTEPVRRGFAQGRRGLTLLLNDLGVFDGLQRQRDAARTAAGLAPEGNMGLAVQLVDQQRQVERFPTPAKIAQGMQDISQSATFSDALAAVVRNPAAVLETTLQSVGASAPALVGAMAGSTTGPAGTATGAALGSFAVEYGNTLQDVMGERGVDARDALAISKALADPELMAEAREKAVKRGLPIAAFDALTAGLAGRLLAGAKPTVASVVARSAGELGLQAGGGAAGEAVAQAATGEYKPGDILMEALAELPSAIVEVPGNYRDSMIRAKSAEQRAQVIEQLNKLAAASKVRERDVDTFEQFIAQAAENGPVQHVYIDANTLMQSGMAEQLAQVSPSVAAQLQTAVATGAEIQIPVAEYTARIAGSEFAQSLVDDIRVEGEQFTRREAREYMQNRAGELQAEFERVLTEKQNDEVFKASAERVKAEIKSQLDTVARFTPQVNEAYASMVRNFYAVMAAKLGTTPEEVFAKYPLRVQAEAVQSGPVLSQGDTTFDWSNPGARGTGGNFARDTKVGDTTISYGVGADGTAEVISVRTPQAKRGGGSARRALEIFLAEADKRGVSVKLQASPLDKKTHLDKLVRFYQSLGFELTGRKINAVGDPEMVRPAKELNQTATSLPATIEIDGKQRPTTNSNGQPIAATEEGVKSFWKWFGDSKVVDADGRPLVVYHGTTADFDTFQENTRGVLFVSPSREWVSKFYTDESGATVSGANTMPVYVRAENPFDFENKKHVGALATSASLGRLAVDQIKSGSWSRLEDRTTLATIKKRFDGLYVMEDGNKNLAVFSPTQIKSAIGNSGEFDPANPNILMQSGSERDLMVTHNLTVANLLHADKMGGLAVPSLAITKKDTPLESFGEITLIGPPEMADPKGYAKTQVFGADIYSPRYPSVERELDSKAWAVFRKKFEPMADEMGIRLPDRDDVERDGFEKLVTNIAVMGQFLRDQGVEPRIVMRKGYIDDARRARLEGFGLGPWMDKTSVFDMLDDPDFVKLAAEESASAYRESGDERMVAIADKMVNDPTASRNIARDLANRIVADAKQRAKPEADKYETQKALDEQIEGGNLKGKFEEYVKGQLVGMTKSERIPQGYTNSGSRKYIPHTLENVVKILKKELRGGENFNYGVGSVRAKFTPQFKSVAQIKKEKGRLISAEQFEAVKGEINKEFSNMADAMNIRSETLSAIMEDGATQGLERAAKTYGIDLTGGRAEQIAEFMDKLRNLPTAYFEAKILRDVSLSEFKAAVVPEGTDPKALDALRKAGITDIRTYSKNDEADRAAKIGEFQELFFQTRGANRGSFNPSTNTITLLKNADLSTFLHEAGHFFLEVQFDIASRLAGMRTDGASLSEGEQQIVDDADALLKWFGVESVPEWYSLDFEEKRGYHEKFARGFEAYLFEGKAPSIELNRIFQTFRGWLTQVYRNIVESARQALKAAGKGTSEREVVGKALDVQLSDEVRAVFDRMLATNEEIRIAEQARSMMPLFENYEDAKGKVAWGIDEFAAYQALGTQATADAIQDVQARTLRDLSWTRNARGREIKRLQKQSAELRREVQMQARREVMSQPIYRAWQFLTAKLDANDKLAPEAARKSDPNVVDPSVDSLFTAIAKLGGLSKDEVTSQWGTDPKDKPNSGVFGKPVWRREGGRSIDSMAEALGELGYLPLDENGKADIRDLEERFDSELRGSPVYSNRYDYGAQQEQRAGDGVNVEALGAGRFDLTEIKAMGLPTEVVDRIQSLKMTGKVGLHPDIVADMFGFTSGDELVRTLATTESPKTAIEGLTDARMLEQYGELATPEAIERAADRAIHNEIRARLIAIEANGLAKATGQRKILTSAARDFARAMIARLKVRDIRPSQYASAEVRAAKAAEKASRSGDLAKAAVEKRNQLVNNYATRAAYDAQDEVERITSFFRDVVTRPDDRVGKTRDMDVVNAARAVLSNFGYAGKAKTALEYLEAVKEYDPATYDVLAASVRTAEEMATPDIRDLTVEQLRALHDEVQSLWHLAKRNRQMEVDGDLLDREDVAADINARMVEFGIPDTAPGESSAITPAEKRLLQIKGVRSILRRVESWVDQMDGSNKIGAFRRGVFNPVKLAADKYRAAKIDALRQFHDSFDSIAGTMKRSTIYAPELGYTFGKDEGGVALNEILHAILHTGNESNKRKLLLGRGWAEEVNGVVDTRRWDAFIARMVAEGKLQREHFDFAQSIWDLMETAKPLAQKAHRDAYGKYFAEVTAQEFTDPFGVVRRGGYVPAQVDSRIVQDNELRKLLEEGKEGMAYAFPATSKGFTNSRVEYNRPLLLDLRTLPQHIDKVLLFSYMEMPVRDVTKLLAMKNVRGPLNKIDPTAISGMLMPWLNRSARQQVTTPVPGDAGMSRFFTALRNRTSMATMFANLSNTAQQITAFSLAAVKVKPRYLLSATAQWISGPKQMARTVAEQSTYMSNRMSSEVDAMLGEIEAVLLDPTLYQRGQEWTKRHTFFMQSAFDNVMGPIIWTGAFNEALEQGYSDKDAAHIADSVVRQTQGSTLPEDVSRIETGPAWARIFTQFASYFNMQANLLGTEFAKVAKEMGLRKGATRGLYIFVAGFYIPALVAEAIAQAFRGGPGDDDDDGEYLDDWLMATLVYGPMRNVTAFVPFAGQVVNSAVARFNGNPVDDRVSVAPVVGALEGVAGVPVDLYQASFDEIRAQRTVKDVATLISLTTGLPASVAAKPIGYLVGVASDKIDPTGEFDFARGLVTGVASPESRGR